MHQGRRLQRLVRPLLGHLGSGQLPQFLINERQELLRRLRFALFDAGQDQRHVARRTLRCHVVGFVTSTVTLRIVGDHDVSPLPEG
jgi:hypothetical protein